MNNQIDDFNIPGSTTRLIQAGDEAELQVLLERCDDYVRLVDGGPVSSQAAYSLLQECPEGKTTDEKVVIGVWAMDRELVGVLDAIMNYPAQDAWWIGLLLIDPGYRNHGLGRLIYQSFENYVMRQNGKGICLGVIEENKSAQKFWQCMGFEEYERQPARQFGNLPHSIITMVRYLTQ